MSFQFIQQIDLLIQHSVFYLKPWLEILGILWCIDIVNWLFLGSRLNYLGIYPRNKAGLIGIIFSPFLHRDFKHLLFNSIPLFFLGLALLVTDGTITFCWITCVIILVSGLCVWLFARKGLHIGASGLISGYFGYILASAYTHPGVITILMAILAIYYFGGIFIGIFPKEKHVSWEGHLFGILSGMLCAFIPNLFLYYV